MAIAQQTRFQTAPTRLETSRLETSGLATRGLANRDVAILIGYAAFAIVLLIAIYLAAMSCGTAPGDLATMTVFP